jgi:hypothetical protein
VSNSSGDMKRRIRRFSYRVLSWAKEKVPPVFRSILGLLFMVGGVFGFLPILGFWMLPLGMALIALDLPPTRRFIEGWMETLKDEEQPAQPDDAH